MNKIERKLIDKIKEYYEEYRKSENKALEDLSRSFILIATIIIPLSATILINKELIQNIGIETKIILLASWGILFLSLLSGLWQIIIEYEFWRKGRKIIRGVYNESYKKIKNGKTIWYSRNKLDLLQSESNILPVRIQIILLYIGLALFVAFIFILVIRSSSFNNYISMK